MPSSKDGDKGTPPSYPLETDGEPSHDEERRRKKNTVCRWSYETTPVGDATAEVDAALVASSLRKKRRLKGGG